MDEAYYLQDRGYAVFATEADAKQLAHERAKQARWDRAWAIYEREIVAHAHPGTRAHLDLNAQTIIETLAGVLPLETGDTIG